MLFLFWSFLVDSQGQSDSSKPVAAPRKFFLKRKEVFFSLFFHFLVRNAQSFILF